MGEPVDGQGVLPGPPPMAELGFFADAYQRKHGRRPPWAIERPLTPALDRPVTAWEREAQQREFLDTFADYGFTELERSGMRHPNEAIFNDRFGTFSEAVAVISGFYRNDPRRVSQWFREEKDGLGGIPIDYLCDGDAKRARLRAFVHKLAAGLPKAATAEPEPRLPGPRNVVKTEERPIETRYRFGGSAAGRDRPPIGEPVTLEDCAEFGIRRDELEHWESASPSEFSARNDALHDLLIMLDEQYDAEPAEFVGAVIRHPQPRLGASLLEAIARGPRSRRIAINLVAGNLHQAP